MNDGPTSLYRHRDTSGNLLYVGISLSAVGRLKQHMAASGWSDQIASVEIERFPTREEAQRAERDAIRKEHPKWNKQHAMRRLRKHDPAHEKVAQWVGYLAQKVERYRNAAVEIYRTSDSAKYARIYGQLHDADVHDHRELVLTLPNGCGVRLLRSFPSTRVTGPRAFSIETQTPARLASDIRFKMGIAELPGQIDAAVARFESQWQHIPVLKSGMRNAATSSALDFANQPEPNRGNHAA